MIPILRHGTNFTIDPAEMLHVDIETRSPVNLPKHGVYAYAMHPDTDIVVVRYAMGESDHIGEWWPYRGDPMPDDLHRYFSDPDILLAAHNAGFERLLFTHCGSRYAVPHTEIERWYCTAYQMSVNNLPRSLGDAGTALNAKVQKSKRGKELINLLSLPQEDGTFREDADLMEEFSEYCAQDVRTERELTHVTRMATVTELQDYWVNEYINDRGVKINKPLAEKAVSLVAEISAEAEVLIKRLTDGAVEKPRGKKLTDWVHERMPEDLVKLMTKQEKKGPGEFEEKITLDRNAREALLERQNELPREVLEVVEVADSVGSGSVAKYQAMVDVAGADHRVRGSYLCSGAPATGRYSAQKLQVHNFSRDCYKDPLPVIDEFLATGKLPDSPMLGLKRLLRACIIAARGKTFVCGDWSAIEGCALPWLTDDERCDKKLQLLHNGEDIYLHTATDLYDEPVTDKSDPRRQIGKVAELALGYGGGAGSFIVMAANYGVHLPPSEVPRVIQKWRRANPGIVMFWDALESAAAKAYFNPGQSFKAGRVEFFYYQMLNCLWCKLPSGRLLTYNQIEVQYDDFDNPQILSLNATVRPKAGESDWPKRKLYGGLLSENVTQAVCADLLRECLRALVRDRHPVCMHTHDEAVLEVPVSQQQMYLEILQDYMDYVPGWAQGMPIRSELWAGDYYRK